jgi:thiamine biosynthesis lipoprotein
MLAQMSRSSLLVLLLLAALLAAGAVALYQTGGAPPRRIALERAPRAVMGTSCRLIAVVPRERAAQAEGALDAAEAELRRVEALMSSWIEASELSRFNAAGPGPFPLSGDTLEVLRAARRVHRASGGAFDVTCRPLVELWRRAAREGVWPRGESVEAARARSSWELIELESESAVKLRGSARVDLGGIAKGFGIDRALEALREGGAEAGLVDVGGDIRVFGAPPGDDAWAVDVRDPRGSGATLGSLRLREGAVCTSGSYARGVVIAGRRVSHIVDPTTGRPAEGSPSVTVLAPTAMQADAWATALSVLGTAGLARRPAGVEALVVTEEAEGFVTSSSRGFPMLESPASRRESAHPSP